MFTIDTDGQRGVGGEGLASTEKEGESSIVGGFGGWGESAVDTEKVRDVGCCVRCYRVGFWIPNGDGGTLDLRFDVYG